MKKIICMLLVILCLAQVYTYAAGDVSVKIGGEQIEFDVPPQIVNGRTMVPMRKIFESLGANVEWIGSARLIIATRNADIVSMEIGKETFSVTNVISGETKKITLDVPPFIVDGRTLVPVRAISESLGLNVIWDPKTRTVFIESKNQDGSDV